MCGFRVWISRCRAYGLRLGLHSNQKSPDYLLVAVHCVGQPLFESRSGAGRFEEAPNPKSLNPRRASADLPK